MAPQLTAVELGFLAQKLGHFLLIFRQQYVREL